MTDTAIRHVPVVIVGAGPTGITAATLLAQYGIESLILERWPGVYRQPSAVHLDDEIYRIIARLGHRRRVRGDLAADAGTASAGQSIQRTGRVPPRAPRAAPTATRRPICSTNRSWRVCCGRTSSAIATSNCAASTDVTERHGNGNHIRVTFADRCDGHDPSGRCRLPAGLRRRQQRGACSNRLHHAGFELRTALAGCRRRHRCRPAPVGWRVPGMRSGSRRNVHAHRTESRYRWEFRLLAGESADDFDTLAALRPLIASWTADVADGELTTAARDRVHLPRPDRRSVAPRQHLHPR